MRWESVSILPFWFCNGSAVVYDNKIHILGGVYDSSAHYSWDGTEWALESTLPVNFYNGSAVVYNNKIHILGFVNHYSWNGTQWTEESELPQADTGFGKNAVVYNNKIHILGTGSGYDAHYSWDGTEWTLESTLPEEFGFCRAVVYNNKIHILGGSAYGHERNSHYSWNGTQWTEESELPCYFGDNAVVYDNKINILGTVDNDNYYYSWNGSQWIEAPALPLPYDFDYGGSGVVYDNKLNILGGETSGQDGHYELKNFNKIIFGLDSLIDLTGDTVTENDVAIGKTFHGPDGNQKIGTYIPPVETETVLWTNPDPTANFSTTNVDLSQAYTNFTKLRFYFTMRTTVQTPVTSVEYFVKDIVENWQVGGSSVGSNTYKQRGTMTLITGGNTYNRYIMKDADDTPTKIYIINSYRHSDASASSAYCIPIKITGINGEGSGGEPEVKTGTYSQTSASEIIDIYTGLGNSIKGFVCFGVVRNYNIQEFVRWDESLGNYFYAGGCNASSGVSLKNQGFTSTAQNYAPVISAITNNVVSLVGAKSTNWVQQDFVWWAW